MAKIKLPPAVGFIVARLRIRFKRHSWTERFWLGAGTQPRNFLNTLNWLCFLRATWLADNCTIDFASCSHADKGKDAVAASHLPYMQPFSAALGGETSDPDAGWQYRFDPATGHWVYLLFRGVPDKQIDDEQVVGQPWGSPSDPLAVGWVPDTTKPAPSTANPPATLTNPAGTITGGMFFMGHSFPLFLAQQTVKMNFALAGAPPLPGQVAVGTWSFSPWAAVNYRRVAERRAGGIFGEPKGRFTPA